MRIPLAMCAVIVALATPSSSLNAQVRASERGGVFQVVNGTKITVEYSRPQVRGRLPVFGSVIPWGKVWTPGANWATTLEVDKDVTVNGHALPKGTYAVWMEVQPSVWAVILDPKAKAFHTNPPKPDSAQVRFAVTPDDGTGPDLLTWSFTEVSAVGTSLRMAWAGKSVTLQVRVPGVAVPAFPEALAGRYTGSYSIQFGPAAATGAAPVPSAGEPPGLVVSYANGRLLGEWAHPPFEVWKHLAFLQIAEDWFHPAALVDGAIYDEVTDLVFEFAVTGGRATGFEIRGPGDKVVGRGTRIP
jgi:hypothetical protein